MDSPPGTLVVGELGCVSEKHGFRCDRVEVQTAGEASFHVIEDEDIRRSRLHSVATVPTHAPRRQDEFGMRHCLGSLVTQEREVAIDGDDAGDANPSRATRAKGWVSRRQARYVAYPPVATVQVVMDRDKEAAGAVAGSAIAFRLFLFFVPLLLFVVGAMGFLSRFTNAHDFENSVGIHGTLAAQIETAFAQPDATRWLAMGLGLFGMATTGRSLSKALIAASASAWQVPIPRRAPLRTVGAIAGLVCAIGLLTLLVNWLRQDLGLGVAGVSLLPILAVYALAWLWVSSQLPRGTSDPGALLPGSAIVALTITAMQAISQFYLPTKLDRASELYGAIGTTVVTLGWFFFLGRSIAYSMEINAVIFERFGSVSSGFFSLPVVRMIPARSRRVRQIFDLEQADQTH